MQEGGTGSDVMIMSTGLQTCESMLKKTMSSSWIRLKRLKTVNGSRSMIVFFIFYFNLSVSAPISLSSWQAYSNSFTKSCMTSSGVLWLYLSCTIFSATPVTFLTVPL